MKVAILGYSGCGKSTLAKYISNYYKIPLLYLDTVMFEENWKARDKNQAIEMVFQFMKNESWVIDGNYTNFLQSKRLEEADYIIYMKFSRLNCLFRVLKRYFKYKNTSRESVSKGCIEKLDLEFIWWVIYSGRTKEKVKHYNNILFKYKEKTIIIKNQKELNKFMKTLFN